MGLRAYFGDRAYLASSAWSGCIATMSVTLSGWHVAAARSKLETASERAEGLINVVRGWARASIEQLKRQAKDLLAEFRAGSAEAEGRVKSVLPVFRGHLADAQLVVAREYGFESWIKLRRRVEAIDLADPKTAFTAAACILERRAVDCGGGGASRGGGR